MTASLHAWIVSTEFSLRLYSSIYVPALFGATSDYTILSYEFYTNHIVLSYHMGITSTLSDLFMTVHPGC